MQPQTNVLSGAPTRDDFLSSFCICGVAISSPNKLLDSVAAAGVGAGETLRGVLTVAVGDCLLECQSSWQPAGTPHAAAAAALFVAFADEFAVAAAVAAAPGVAAAAAAAGGGGRVCCCVKERGF